MIKLFNVMLIFYFILNFGCSQVNSGGGVTKNKADMNGKWKGKTESGIDFIAVISEKDSLLNGTLSVPVIEFNKVQLQGYLNGENAAFSDINGLITFNGKISGNNASGTYNNPSAGDAGRWNAVKSAVYIFYEGFDRADSSVIGNNWHEGEGSGVAGKIDDVSISDGKVLFTGGYESTYQVIPTISRTVTLSVPFEAEYVFSVDNGGFYNFDISFVATDTYDINFNNDRSISYAYIHNGTGTLIPLTTNYQLMQGHIYDLTVSVTSTIFTIYITDNGSNQMVYTFPATGTLTSFFGINISGGYHDGTASYKTLLDSVSFE